MSQKPKKKKKSSSGGSVFLSILLVLLLAAIMGAVAFGIYKLLYKPPTDTSPLPAAAVSTPEPTAAPRSTDAPGETAAQSLVTPEPTPLHVHLWKEATCTEPRTCQTCGYTEGEPLGHDPTTADYWSPSVCLRCREELEPALTPDFELRGLQINMEQGMIMGYTTVCANDATQATRGQAIVNRYSVMRSNGKIVSIPGKYWSLPEKPGYEWRFVDLSITFDDHNAQNYGFNIKDSLENYYTIVDHSVKPDFSAAMPTPDPEATPTPSPNPLQITTESHNNATHTYTDDVQWVEEKNWYESSFIAEYKGETYICTRVYDGALSGWNNGSNVFHYAMAVQVPAGYDGCVLCLYDARHGAAGVDWKYIYDVADQNTLFFRLA